MVEQKEVQNRERQVAFRSLVNLPSTTYATFGLYRYPAKFIPHVIAYILEHYGKPGMRVFDPFAGYGTVGVVSRLYGCNYELWDLNPIVETLHKIAILKPKELDLAGLVSSMRSSHETFTPDWSKFDYWFPREFVPVLTQAWGYYHSLEDEYAKLVLTIPLLKASRQFSFDDMGRMKLSRSPKSKARIARLLEGDWKSRYYSMLKSETASLLKKLQEYQQMSPKDVVSKVKGGVDALTEDLSNEVDMLITSPPYLQSQEYIRYAKMDLYWLGIREQEIKRLSQLEIPYRRVTPKEIRSETFKAIRDGIIEEHIRKVYDAYFNAVLGSLSRLSEKVSSYLFLFVGRSSMRGKPVPIDRITTEHFGALGWTHEETLVDTIVARRLFSYRVNPATQIEDDRTSSENLVILRRP